MHGILRARSDDESVDLASGDPETGIEQEERPKSQFVPASLFHDSGFGASHATQSSYAVTVASNSSFVSSLGEKDSVGLRVQYLQYFMKSPRKYHSLASYAVITCPKSKTVLIGIEICGCSFWG